MEPNEQNKTDSETTCCIAFWRHRKKPEKSEETEPLLVEPANPNYGRDTSTDKDNVNGGQHNVSSHGEENSEKSSGKSREGSTKSTGKSSKATGKSGKPPTVEEIKMKPLNIKKIDEIFKKFEETFGLFSASQKAMLKAVAEFKTTVKAGGEFTECLKEFKRQLNNEAFAMKKLVLKIPKAIAKGGGTVGNAATALTKILEVYSDMGNLPVKVADTSISCVKEVMELDPTEIMSQEFSGSAFDLGKIPKQMTNMRENLKEIKKAPGIVKSFFEYSTSIVMEIADVFGNEKTKEEITKKEGKVEQATKEKATKMAELDNPKPPKEVDFKSVKIPSIDRLFSDIAKIINPVAKLSKDLYESRNNLEKAMKAISKFREDETKAFGDYLDELKERVKKGDVHITVTVQGSRIDVTKVEGLEPNVMKSIRCGINGVINSGNEIEDLGPDTLQKLIKLIKDVSQISTSDIKSHVSLKEMRPAVSALNENTRKAKEIPGVLKFFLSFIQNLLMDILDVVHADDDQKSQTGSQEDESTVKN